jgi:hypothetical protein
MQINVCPPITLDNLKIAFSYADVRGVAAVIVVNVNPVVQKAYLGAVSTFLYLYQLSDFG